ncbi:MAG TPA: hypothetical protein VF334_10595, partial [Polyangia bacterium]
IERGDAMLRASLAALAVATLLLWLVGVTDGATVWMTWLNGIAAVLTLSLVPITRADSGPIGAAAGPTLIGGGLIVMFIVGLVTHASGWLTWFTGAFGAGYLLYAAFAFAVQAVDPQLESRRPLQAM